jgi:hypothetical protein
MLFKDAVTFFSTYNYAQYAMILEQIVKMTGKFLIICNRMFSSGGVGSVGSSREDTPFEDWWMGRIAVCCGF